MYSIIAFQKNKMNNGHLQVFYIYRYKEIDTITKVNFILTNHLIDFLNGSRAFSFVSSWGYKDVGDGSWSGMIGQLTKKEADIGGYLKQNKYIFYLR